MTQAAEQLTQTITLSEARALITALAHEQSILLLSPPGVGKSDVVRQAADAAGLPCRSLLGTQIAPEDVSGIPRIVGERSVFCPPRVLLPESPQPFCLFLDELPACTPDIQKAFYSLLLERRLGEHFLPAGSWVVAAGNRAVDRALVRSMSSALVNRVIVLNVRVDNAQWLAWARANAIRAEILAFIALFPEALARPVPAEPVPFSTPRAWHSLSRALDLAARGNILTAATRRSLAFGRISAQDAAIFCTMEELAIRDIRPVDEYVNNPALLPAEPTALWFVVHRIRDRIANGDLNGVTPAAANNFLSQLKPEYRFSLLVDLVPHWSRLGADGAMLATLKEAVGL